VRGRKGAYRKELESWRRTGSCACGHGEAAAADETPVLDSWKNHTIEVVMIGCW